MVCGIDCPCGKCEKIRKFLRNESDAGNIIIVGTDEDKNKIMRVDE